MLLTRFVKIQLTIFTIVSLIGIAAMVLVYVQVPTLLGIGRITVTMELTASGGLYQFSNVTYRGVEVGKVTAVQRTHTGVKATLSLATSPKIPANLEAHVQSISAVGEQYVDLQPRTSSGPYLEDGSLIALRDTKIPPPVGPMLDKLNGLVDSIPQDKLSTLLDESFKGFNGSGYDLSSLFDSSSTLTHDLNEVADRSSTLLEDSRSLLDSQHDSADSIRTWTHSLAGVTDQLVANDPQIRTLLQNGSGAADEASRLLDQLKPTLPILLANLTTLGRVGVVYHASLEELLVLVPPLSAYFQSSTGTNNPTGQAMGDFRVSVEDPPACTVGFLPQSEWRSPADTTTLDTPDGLYCKLPQDSPIAVRGLRNAPCQNNPGKRAPTVQECYSDQPYQPLAMRQHALGPAPMDPNLIRQGIAPDDRTTFGNQIYAPIEGTPLPPGAGVPPGLGPGPAPGSQPPVAPPGPQSPPAPEIPPPPPSEAGDGPPAAPSAFTTSRPGARPSLAVASYDPRTGYYAASDGQTYRQTDLVNDTPKSWQDLMVTGGP